MLIGSSHLQQGCDSEKSQPENPYKGASQSLAEVKALEKVCTDLVSGAKAKDLKVAGPTRSEAQSRFFLMPHASWKDWPRFRNQTQDLTYQMFVPWCMACSTLPFNVGHIDHIAGHTGSLGGMQGAAGLRLWSLVFTSYPSSLLNEVFPPRFCVSWSASRHVEKVVRGVGSMQSQPKESGVATGKKLKNHLTTLTTIDYWT